MNKRRKRRRQKRIISIITIVVALILVAIAAVYFKINKDEVAPNGSTASISSTLNTSKNENKTAEKGSTTSTETDNTYENLIAGTGKLNFSYYMDNVYANIEYPAFQDELFGYLKSREYTLPELIAEFNDIFKNEDRYFGDEGVTYVGYSYLDCGNDGNKELAIQIVCPVVEEYSSLTMILKEMEGDIQVVHAFCQWSRSSSDINEYGVITSFGSSGATLHGWDTSIIDANGKYNFGYSEDEQADINMFHTGEEHPEVDIDSYEGDIVIYSLRTKEYSEENAWPEYYSYAVYKDYQDEMDIPNLYTDSQYQKIMDTFGVDFIPMDEFNQKIEDRLNEIGATKNMVNGKSLEFTEIKF